MKYTHILWDFNGTILDDVQTGIKSINTLLERRNLPVIPDESYYKDVFTFPIINYYKRLGFDFSKEPFDIIAHEWVKEYMENVKDAGVNDGVIHLLKRAKEQGVKQYILSATQLE
ncbi:MAG: HAD hydrolase-like protein, partial [Clostridia bacterium]|nr:HAD hydrolase-like protein [Clostridia bacterium]